RFSFHKLLSPHDRVPEPPWLGLVHPLYPRSSHHLIESIQLLRQSILPPLIEDRHVGKIRGEVFPNRSLSSPHNKTKVPDSRLLKVLEDQLDNRLHAKPAVFTSRKDRKHLLRLGLRN